MYELMVRRDFVAQHFLTVPNCGPENEWHSHHFELEVILRGDSLNQHGYLVDIDEVKEALDAIVDRYRDTTLNDLPEFEGLNPSVEHFARIVCDSLNDRLSTSTLEGMEVKIWEDEEAWASYATS
jgi:6-pyruvoyltetrahydropterin/6-carboxytetrahydropterin synthase